MGDECKVGRSHLKFMATFAFQEADLASQSAL